MTGQSVSTIEPETGPAAEPAAPADRDLAILLARLAGLQGSAVPAHRFGMLEITPSGAPVAQLDRPTRAVELWRARFPDSEVRVAASTDIPRGDLPALWIHNRDESVRLLRGSLSGGGFASEDAAGEPHELDAAAALEGTILVLKTSTAGSASTDTTANRSATQWFVHAIGKRRGVFIEAILATFLVNSLGLVTALYTLQVYDRVVPLQSYSTLWVLTAGVGVGVLLELISKQVRTFMVNRGCKVIDQELSAVFFGKALSIRLDARPRSVGTFASQIRQFETVRNFMTASTLFVLADAPFAILLIGVIALIAGPVAYVPLAFVPLAVISGFAFTGKMRGLAAQNLADSNRKNGVLIEAIDGIESIKAAGGEWKLLDQWQTLTADIAEVDLKSRAFAALSTNLTGTIQQLSYVFMIAAGAYAIGAGNLTIGGLIACSIIGGRALGPIAQIAGLVQQWQYARAGLKGLDLMMALPSERESDIRLVVPDRCEGRLQCQNVRFSYGGERPAVEVAQLSIGPGDRIAILGPVGSGKSTLIKLLAGLYRPGSGQVLLDGVDVAQLAPEFVREHIGYLPQDVRLFNGTLRDNLILGLPSPSDAQILAAANLTGLNTVIESHPRGLGLEITEGGRGLSVGQRQIAGLTRLILAQSRVLLLDEPTASMDTSSEENVIAHLSGQIAKDSVLVIVTHKLGLLRHANRVLAMEQGRIAWDGSKEEFMSRVKKRQERLAVAAASQT